MRSKGPNSRYTDYMKKPSDGNPHYMAMRSVTSTQTGEMLPYTVVSLTSSEIKEVTFCIMYEMPLLSHQTDLQQNSDVWYGLSKV